MLENNTHPNYACKPNETLYRLSQSPRKLYVSCHRFLMLANFEQLWLKPNLYIILGVYMDNLPIVDTFEEEAIKFIAKLQQQVPI